MYSFVFFILQYRLWHCFRWVGHYDYYAKTEVQCKKVRVGCYII